MNQRFWNWARDENTQQRTLYLNGPIAEASWFGDEVTPQMFKDELFAGKGDITVWLCSPGGDVFAATQIYTALMEYAGHVTIKIDSLAASAASVIAMAGSDVLMSPTAYLMVHNPATIVIGDGEEMLRAKAMLDEVKEGIISAYELKSNMSRAKISKLMDAETWLNARKAVELGLADGILYVNDEVAKNEEQEPAMLFSRAAVMNSIIGKLPKLPEPKQTGVPVKSLNERLYSLINNK